MIGTTYCDCSLVPIFVFNLHCNRDDFCLEMALFSCSGSSVYTNKTNIITYVFSIHLYDFKYAAITVLEYDENFILL